MLPTFHLRLERWKFNKDYGIYVSTLGNFKDRHKRNLPIKINSNGYCMVKTECPQPWKLAHRVVMLTWKHIPDAESLTVDHLNHNKRDNSLRNLEWVTRKENLARATVDFLPITLPCKSSLEIFQESIVGYEVNGMIYPNADAIWQVWGPFFDNKDYREKELRVAIRRINNKQNTSAIKRIGNKKHNIVVKAVFNK